MKIVRSHFFDLLRNGMVIRVEYGSTLLQVFIPTEEYERYDYEENKKMLENNYLFLEDRLKVLVGRG